MRVCTVIGHVVTTAKHPILEGRKLLVVSGLEGKNDPTVPMQLASDGVGAGIGSQVVVSESGIAGGQVTGVKAPAVRSVVVGIID
jgi:ethanolamine utilization protein EutN